VNTTLFKAIKEKKYKFLNLKAGFQSDQRKRKLHELFYLYSILSVMYFIQPDF